MYPLARTADLIVEELSSETIVYDQKRRRAHCLNKTAGLIWQHCDGKTSLPSIARQLSQATGLPVDEEIVALGLRELSSRGLLAAKPVRMDARSRRQWIGRLAVAGSAAIALLPAITSIVAPTPAMAQSGDAHGSEGKGKGKGKGKSKLAF